MNPIDKPRCSWLSLLSLVSLLCAIVLCVGACSDAQLMERPPSQPAPIDNSLTLHTTVCLNTPSEVVFPIKLIFAVDTSGSMDISDPMDPLQMNPLLATGRSTAVWNVVQQFKDQPGVDIAVVKFGAAASVVTNCPMTGACFYADTTANQGQLASAVVELNVAAGTTDYEGAMDAIFQLISTDVMAADKVTLARSNYIVVFMSDGLPDPTTADYNNVTTITKVVNDLNTLKNVFHIGGMTVNTALLATDQPAFVAQQNGQVLQAMAMTGNGLFRSFPNGESINFLGYNITSLRRAFTLKSFLAFPLNTDPHGGLPGGGELLVDSDGDGLSDVLEAQIGTDPTHVDTDGDGYSDLLEYRFRSSGFDPLNPDDADCSQPGDRDDDDGDGVLNCEERFLGTSRVLPDSDADGLPDGVELHAGTDPTHADVIQDSDQDGTSNPLEVIAHSDPELPDAQNRSLLAQRYIRVDAPIDPMLGGSTQDASRPCYDVTVENISLVQGLPGALVVQGGQGDTLGGYNRILLWAGEVPFDDAAENGTYQIACVDARFFNDGDKFPPNGQVTVPVTAWSPAGQTPPTCVGP